MIFFIVTQGLDKIPKRSPLYSFIITTYKRLICFFITDRKIAPMAPTPADSVGVANPPKIDPKTKSSVQ